MKLITLVVIGGLGLLIGGLIGHFVTKNSLAPSEKEQKKLSLMDRHVVDKWKSESDLVPKMINMVSRTNIRNNHKELTAEPHLAATPRDDVLAEMVLKRFKDAGLDTSELVPYHVLLSRPDKNKPNLITIYDKEANVIFQSKFKEVAHRSEDQNDDLVHAYNAFSPAADVTTAPGTGVIYVNYGRVEDFNKLDELGINISGHIVMSRYGKIFRGNKLLHAQQRGAKGMILFSDPTEMAWEGTDEDHIYPNTFWLPESAMQRGTTYMLDGDPLTPFWPSTEYAYRLEEEEADLPTIPCQPIGYGDAKEILNKMAGPPPPVDWFSGLKNISHNLGPQMKAEFKDYTLRLQTHNSNQIRRSFNVIGTIRGETEPDRYVLIGNHRDAWGFGGSDPSSGTAQFLETIRVFGELLKEGWRPRRTLVFCNWGSEEQGIIGSAEWVEENVHKLQERSVLYLNTDTCASGTILNAMGSPLLWDAIKDVTKMIPGVVDGKSVYDEWKKYHVLRNQSDIVMQTLGGMYDHSPFAFYSGIPSLNVAFRLDKNKYPISKYPYYHTNYDNFYMLDQIMDPGFKIIQGCSRLALLTLKYFGDSTIIPYSLERMPEAIKNSLNNFEKNGQRDILATICHKYKFLEESVDNFTYVTSDFVKKLKEAESKIDQHDPLMIRALNDQLMKLEQVFLLPTGLPNRPQIKHAVFAPGILNKNSAAGFPGLEELLYKREDLILEEKDLRDKQIKRHISDLIILVQRATSLLEDFHFI